MRAGTVFTTHTPVPAGIDRFDRDLVAAHLTGLPHGALPAERILDLGAEEDPTIFNMAHMGLRLGQRANGVSLLHGEVSREMFADLWPGFDVAEVPITSVTNGVHAPDLDVARDPRHRRARGRRRGARRAAAAGTPSTRSATRELWQVRNTLRGAAGRRDPPPDARVVAAARA